MGGHGVRITDTGLGQQTGDMSVLVCLKTNEGNLRGLADCSVTWENVCAPDVRGILSRLRPTVCTDSIGSAGDKKVDVIRSIGLRKQSSAVIEGLGRTASSAGWEYRLTLANCETRWSRTPPL